MFIPSKTESSRILSPYNQYLKYLKDLKLIFLFRLDANFTIQEEIQYFLLLTVTLL